MCLVRKKNKEFEEVYNKEEIDNSLSQYLLNDNIVVIYGTISSVNSNSAGSISASYPEGFNVNNCVPIAVGIKITEGKGYNYIGDYKDSSDLLFNAYRRRLNLTNDNIVLTVFNPTSEPTNIYYQITLMKLPEPDITGYRKGDVNMDGEITIEDTELIQGFIMGTEPLTDKQIKLADVNEDGTISAKDYQILQNYTTSDYELGDVNMDGVVNQADLDLLIDHIQNGTELITIQKLLADMNGDGEINSGDTLILSQKINGIEP